MNTVWRTLWSKKTTLRRCSWSWAAQRRPEWMKTVRFPSNRSMSISSLQGSRSSKSKEVSILWRRNLSEGNQSHRTTYKTLKNTNCHRRLGSRNTETKSIMHSSLTAAGSLSIRAQRRQSNIRRQLEAKDTHSFTRMFSGPNRSTGCTPAAARSKPVQGLATSGKGRPKSMNRITLEAPRTRLRRQKKAIHKSGWGHKVR